MSILNCKYCGLAHDTDFNGEHEDECSENPENKVSSQFKENVENRIKELIDSEKPIINGHVPENDIVSHIMIVEDRDVRVRVHDKVIEWEADDVCEYCGGTGEVSTMEQVYPGEPHMADVGTEKCICQITE